MRFLCLFAACVLTLGLVQGQQANPVILQAVTPAPVPAAASANAKPAASAGDATSPLQLLQEMQATNAATLKKQEAALETLDALQKAAEEIKIYSKRG